MRARLFALAAAALLSLGPAAQAAETASDLAERGADLLAQAALALSEAATSTEEVRALTETVRGYEAGLAALREGMRRAAAEERVLRDRLAPRRAALADLVVLLQTQSRIAGPLIQAHPEGALPAIRAGMIAADMTPNLGDEVNGLLADLADLDAVVALQKAGIAQLRTGLSEVRTARLALVNAVAERRPPPRAFSTDAAAMEALINSSETLGAFADSLTRPGAPALLEAADWPLPVRGSRLRGFGEPDAAGVARPGWLISTRPSALVTAPVAASVRFADRVPDHGMVVILEPAPGEMVILAGLGEILTDRGEIVSEGDPIGLMPAPSRPLEQNLIETGIVSGQPRAETLYIELRQDEAPVDPARRFVRGTEEG